MANEGRRRLETLATDICRVWAASQPSSASMDATTIRSKSGGRTNPEFRLCDRD
ncbi:hypothetical protein SNOG_16028 [Parastagonospora nodorum SN15]|uniref:Uncharacterized protein n=1 Tax=Phaeosphaeria nodorum (strain SN15 / ATCC MYA-4574 / FGSC 10173) TaxID=321614 RepID=Q0TWU6_PHANO|nr:hypothetical protein SNOG_16028 [Parastagonospora nodorum SN15]EAT76607.1 hypothetical protein SNOG_16028 [Parastagonospora nodorum SN15]